MEFTLTNQHLIELINLKKNKVRILKNTAQPLVGFTIIFYIIPMSVIVNIISPEDRSFLEYRSLQLVTIIIFSIFYVGILDYFFLGTIRKLSKDIKHRSGIIEKHRIIRKQYYPLTKDKFFFFEKSTMPNIEVDLETFYKFSEGDFYTVLKSKHSNIVLQDIHRREINFDLVWE